jgi:hypothetical protein
MSKWVEVESLIEAHYQHCNEHHGEADVFYTWSLELMRNAPSVDLVRCGECKWADNCSQNVAIRESYQMYEKLNFCSYGERKESE